MSTCKTLFACQSSWVNNWWFLHEIPVSSLSWLCLGHLLDVLNQSTVISYFELVGPRNVLVAFVLQHWDNLLLILVWSLGAWHCAKPRVFAKSAVSTIDITVILAYTSWSRFRNCKELRSHPYLRLVSHYGNRRLGVRWNFLLKIKKILELLFWKHYFFWFEIFQKRLSISVCRRLIIGIWFRIFWTRTILTSNFRSAVWRRPALGFLQQQFINPLCLLHLFRYQLLLRTMVFVKRKVLIQSRCKQSLLSIIHIIIRFWIPCRFDLLFHIVSRRHFITKLSLPASWRSLGWLALFVGYFDVIIYFLHVKVAYWWVNADEAWASWCPYLGGVHWGL